MLSKLKMLSVDLNGRYDLGMFGKLLILLAVVMVNDLGITSAILMSLYGLAQAVKNLAENKTLSTIISLLLLTNYFIVNIMFGPDVALSMLVVILLVLAYDLIKSKK